MSAKHRGSKNAEISANAQGALLATHYEQENARLARLVHDGPAQKLTVAMIELSLWKSDLEDGKTIVPAVIQNLSELLQSVSGEVREVTNCLRPRALDLFGVGAAIESLVNKRGRAAFHRSSENLNMQPDIAIQLVRIADALLAAIDRTTELVVNFAHDGGFVTLRLDGTGEFDIPAQAAARAIAFGGRIEQQPKCVTVYLPGRV